LKDDDSFKLIIVGLGEWLWPEVGDELLHAPLAHAVSRSDGGRAHACDEERAHAVCIDAKHRHLETR
jgi:hypothetical protein